MVNSPASSQSMPQSTPSSAAMAEFWRLRQDLLLLTLGLMGLIVGPVWYFYSLNTALNYLLGACTGVVYLGLLARNVEQLGRQRQRLGKNHLAIFIALILVATQWQQLHVLPVFLGFLTYKAAILVYTIKTLFSTS